MDESIVKHLEQPQVGTLKLSEAIRIGARMRPQCTGSFFSDGGSCAIGAAMEAIGVQYVPNLCSATPEFMRQFPQVMEAPRQFAALGLEIYKMNDHRKFTREQIADWLERRGY